MNRIKKIIRLYENWFAVILERAGLMKLSQVTLRNGLKFNLLSNGSRPIIGTTIGDKRYTKYKDVQKGDLVIDVGAYIGDFTVYAGSKGARVIAIEPTKESFKKLKENIALNHLIYVTTPMNVAVGTFRGISELYIHKWEGINSLINAKKLSRQSSLTKIEKVETILLEDLLVKYEKIDFLKIDTEGSEANIILSTPRQLLKRVKYIAMESTDYLHIGKENHSINRLLISYLKLCGFELRIEGSTESSTINSIMIYATNKINK